MAKIWIEVAYAKPDKQVIKALQVEQGTNLYDAVRLAQMETVFPELNLDEAKIGVFSKPCPNPKKQTVEQGQRIEIYRPLTMDPKQMRLIRAQKQQKNNA